MCACLKPTEEWIISIICPVWQIDSCSSRACTHYRWHIELIKHVASQRLVGSFISTESIAKLLAIWLAYLLCFWTIPSRRKLVRITVSLHPPYYSWNKLSTGSQVRLAYFSDCESFISYTLWSVMRPLEIRNWSGQHRIARCTPGGWKVLVLHGRIR